MPSGEALWAVSVSALNAATANGDALADALELAARLGSSASEHDAASVLEAAANVERLSAAFAKARGAAHASAVSQPHWH